MFLQILAFGGGFVGSVLLNDIWEKAMLPGYNQTLFNVGSIGVGVDDVFQFSLGLIPLVYGWKTKNATMSAIGVGMMIGTLATKFGENFGFPIKVFKVSGSTATESFKAVEETRSLESIQINIP